MNEREDRNLTPEEQELQRAVRGLGEVRANDAFQARLREQFMSGEIADDAGDDSTLAEQPAPGAQVVDFPRHRHRGRWAAAVAIAAALAVVFLAQGEATWQLQDVRGDGTVAINGQSVPVAERSKLADLIVPEAHIVVPEGVALDALLADVLVVGGVGPADFTLPAAPDEAPYVYQVTVNSGEFRIKSGPGFSGRKAVMRTTEGTAEITGTTIAVFKNEDVTCVCVLEGEAMIGRDGDHMDPIPAGMRKVMFADGRDPMIVTIEPAHEQSLLEFEALNHDTFK